MKKKPNSWVNCRLILTVTNGFTYVVMVTDMISAVVMFRGVTVPPDPFTIVLDFCNGGSLHTTLKSGEDISKEKEIEWALDIATGMVCCDDLFSLMIVFRHIYNMVLRVERSYTEIWVSSEL